MSKTIITETNQNIGYQGVVTLTVKNNQQIISKHRIHNSGRVPLFKFLANCLSANWGSAQSNFPSKIILFKADPSETSSQTFNELYWTTEYAVTPDVGILQSTVPVVIGNEENNSCTVKYHFRIPTSLISSTNIGKSGLYSQLATINNPLAYVFVDSETQDALEGAEGNPNLVVLLDWELTISNKI